MSGTLGMLILSGSANALDFTHPFLRFGEHCHLGADVAYGCERFVFSPA
jgi:hypothetical protein